MYFLCTFSPSNDILTKFNALNNVDLLYPSSYINSAALTLAYQNNNIGEPNLAFSHFHKFC